MILTKEHKYLKEKHNSNTRGTERRRNRMLEKHLFGRKKFENRSKDNRFIKHFGFKGKFAKTCYKQNLFSTFVMDISAN